MKKFISGVPIHNLSLEIPMDGSQKNKPYYPIMGKVMWEMSYLLVNGYDMISPSLFLWRRLEVLNEYQREMGEWFEATKQIPLFETRKKELQNPPKSIDMAPALESKEMMESLWEYGVYTNYAVARHPNGDGMLVPNAQYLRELNEETKLFNGLAVMPDGMFESLAGYRFTLGEIGRYGRHRLTEKQALVDPIWGAVIPNRTLRNASIVNTFARGKYLYNLTGMMGISFPDVEKKPVMGIVCIQGLANGSSAEGWHNLREKSTRAHLIGVSPGVTIGDVRKLEYIIQPK